MRFPALPGQLKRNQRVVEQGRVGTPSFRRYILGAGTTIVAALGLGLACLNSHDIVLEIVGLGFFVGALMFTWVFIPVLILNRSEHKRRRSAV
jgi:hypothetical protein